MTRFYLHLHNRLGFVRDEEGAGFASLHAAREVALASIRDIISEEAKAGQIDLRGRIVVANEADETLAVVPFAEAVEVHLEGQRA